ncbi:MAG TPA: ABC transporter substrate-binding protein, partial [Polyangiaceae bacterium]|nr:ABC transporter substrate-binding protein [Polyangiaceae bacterium]
MLREISGVLALAALVPLWGCSSPELEGTNFSCRVDTDCGSGQICADMNGALACQAPSSVPIRIGMSAPLQGASAALGIEMRRGINAMLDRVNDGGGVHGREVQLEALNDNYDPDTALDVTRQLLDVETVVEDMDRPDVRGKNGVFALVGNVGTPTMLATAPIATKNKVVFFGPFTGAQAYLRDDTKSPYVYNYRAGYADETAAMIDYIHSVRIPRIISDPASDYRRILVFAQEDTYGSSGYDGVVNAYNQSVGALPDAGAIARVGYTREDLASVDPAIERAGEYLAGVLARAPSGNSVESVAIVMIDTYQMGNRFIRGVKDWINADAARAARLDVLFMNVSFVGGDALSGALRATPESYDDVRQAGAKRTYAEDVIVTQVVPNYDSQAAGVVQYRDDIREYDGGTFSFTSLEGYIVARLFTTALIMNGPNLTTDNFLRTLDTQIEDLDIGIGTTLNFSGTNHQASSTVWGS